MKSILIFILLLGLIAHTKGLTCYSCSETSFDGESTSSRDCFTTSSSTPTENCPANTVTNTYYCRTQFILLDGMATSVTRGCISAASDEDSTSTSMPTRNKCQTSLSTVGNPVDTTNCYYHCNTDNCNSITTTTLKTCSSGCSRSSGQGACDYITGTCVCNAGYTGNDCSADTATAAPTYRSCVQCNSETDSGCSTSTTGTTCPATQQYCSSAQTMIYDLTTSQQPIRTIITRGCTSAWVAVDECAFSNIYNDVGLTGSGYQEYTCYSTCDTDNCNTNTPDGTVNGSEQKIIHCQQCSGTTGDCSVSRTPCPSSSTHCKATVVYLVSPKTDLNYEAPPDYKLESVVRECASAAVTTECTETDVIGTLSLKRVTCQETCQTDGCNTGWPARPTCLQCSSVNTDIEDGYDTCLENPDVAGTCQFPYDEYCYSSDIGPRDAKQGYSRRIERGCSHYNRGSGCSTQSLRGISVQQCNYTCTSDGCNVGNDGAIPVQTVVATLIPTLFGWMMQFRL